MKISHTKEVTFGFDDSPNSSVDLLAPARFPSTVVDLKCAVLVIREVKYILINRKHRPPFSRLKKYDVELSFSYIDGDGDTMFRSFFYTGYCPLLYLHRGLLKSLMRT